MEASELILGRLELDIAVDDVIEATVTIKKHVQTLNARLQYTIDFMDGQGLLEEHCFTFPDGETFWATGYDLDGS